MTSIRDISVAMEEMAPSALAEKWDNVGLLVGGYNTEVKRVMIALDMDRQTLDEAAANGVDLVVTHHPIMLQAVNRITDDTPQGRVIQGLIGNNIAMYAVHTNLDSADGGVNDILAQALCLENVEKLEAEGFDGSARMGRLAKSMPLGEFCEYVRDRLNSAVVKCVGDKNIDVRKVGVCGGSGAFMMSAACDMGCDVLVTGEAKYSDEQTADGMGFALIEAGHYETEAVVCEAVRDYLQKKFSDIEVFVSKRAATYYE